MKRLPRKLKKKYKILKEINKKKYTYNSMICISYKNKYWYLAKFYNKNKSKWIVDGIGSYFLTKARYRQLYKNLYLRYFKL